MSDPIVSVDEESLRKDVVELFRKTAQDTLNAPLEQEAEEMVGAERYECTAGREAYRSGHYKRKLVTTSGQVELGVPKPRGATFQTAVIERYRRRETGVEEAIIEMYLAGVSTRRIEDVGEILWGAGVSAGTVSNLNEKAYKSVEEWCSKPLAEYLRGQALDQDPHEQRHRAAQPRDQAQDEGGRHLPRWPFRLDAGDRQARVHRRVRGGKRRYLDVSLLENEEVGA